MKSIKLLTLTTTALTASLLVAACTKLDDRVYSQIVAGSYQPDATDLLRLSGNAYAQLRAISPVNTDGLQETQDATSDEVVYAGKAWGWVDGGVWARLHKHTWTPQDGQITAHWNKLYEGITRTNLAIYQIQSGLLPVDDATKTATLAELRGLRALYYYYLCDLYGNVPIVTNFDVPVGFTPEQSTRQQVNDFILKELADVTPNLTETVSAATYGRFTKWSAYALLAKMYLNAGVYTGTPQWQKCIDACDLIIKSGKFSLAANQKDPFKVVNENGSEAVFAIPYDQKQAAGNIMFRKTLNGEHIQTFTLQAGGGWGGSTIVPQFIDSYDMDDARLKENYLYGPQKSATGTQLTVGLGSETGQPFVIRNTSPSVDRIEENDGYRLAKWEFPVQGIDNQSNDFYLFRYTDVLMMKAECQLRLGSAADAATIVSQVRARSFKNTPTKATVTAADLQKGSSYPYGRKENNTFQSQEGGADIQYGRMLDELGWEFAMEGRRRQDMIRFGAYTTKSWLSHTPSSAYRTLFPIPLEQLNKNPKLKQNPGY